MTDKSNTNEVMNCKARRRAAAVSIIASLTESYPGTFSVWERRRRPLKVGIGDDILAGGTFTRRELGAALGLYCGSRGYLRAMRLGRPRIDLAGTPAGTVTPEEAKVAADELYDAIKRAAARKKRQATAPAAPPATSENLPAAAPRPIKRLNPSDLRAAARARKQAAA